MGSSSVLVRVPSSRLELRDSQCVNEVNRAKGEQKESDLITGMSRNSESSMFGVGN
jgi:hypothetical protein